MSEFAVEQLTDPNHEDIAAVLNLFKDIPGRTCTVATYLDYLHRNWMLVGLFVARKDGRIVGFTQAAAPSQLEPKVAWLPFSRATSSCPHKVSCEAVELAVVWMKGFGATSFKMTTVRKPRALTKLWGIKVSKEILMEKDI